jgi:hypothetical protein
VEEAVFTGITPVFENFYHCMSPGPGEQGVRLEREKGGKFMFQDTLVQNKFFKKLRDL